MYIYIYRNINNLRVSIRIYSISTVEMIKKNYVNILAKNKFLKHNKN